MSSEVGSMKRLCRWVCKKLCGFPEAVPLFDQVPSELREATHTANNSIAILQGVANSLRSSADALTDIVVDMQQPGSKR